MSEASQLPDQPAVPEKYKKPEVPAPAEKAESKRFVEKGPFVVLDQTNEIHWMKKDSWQDKGKFFNWHESKDYAELKNVRKIGGFSDWRLPTRDEAQSLYVEDSENPGKGGVSLHIDTAFPEGAFKVIWLGGDTSTRRPRFDYSEGKVFNVDEYAFGAVRLCRKEKYQPGKIRKGR